MILQKFKRFKKVLFASFLFPIVPVLSIPEGENGENENSENQDNTNGENSNSENGNDGNGEDGNNSSGQVIFNSQAELDNLLKSRINKAIKKTREELEAEKKKESLSELERLKLEKEESDQKLIEATNRSNQFLIQSKVVSIASKLKIRDPEAAFILMDKDDVSIDDNGKVLGIENSLKALIKEKPYLLDSGNNDSNNQNPQSGGDDQNAGSNKPNGSSVDMNYLIRRKAGYVD
jgi:hypothetical protein